MQHRRLENVHFARPRRLVARREDLDGDVLVEAHPAIHLTVATLAYDLTKADLPGDGASQQLGLARSRPAVGVVEQLVNGRLTSGS